MHWLIYIIYSPSLPATLLPLPNPDDGLTDKERARQKAQTRIDKRREESEKNKSTDVLRAPVVVVLGHVDTGELRRGFDQR